MSRFRILAIAVTVAALAIVTGSPVRAADGPKASPSWSMVPQSKDVNGDGFIDGDGGVPRHGALSVQPSAARVGTGNHVAEPNERLIDGALSWYLSGAGYPVRLDACHSRGDRYRWLATADTGATTRTQWTPLTKKQCATSVVLGEGPEVLTLEVEAGGRVARARTTALIRNILFVALGDSYASGEGNPRNVRAWLKNGGALDPYWDDDACHRSVHGAPAQAALALERSSPKTSVTLVDVACAGATIDSGILGAQTDAGQSASQIEQAARIVAGREVDLVTLSVGGNDIGFGSILATCATNSDCPLARASAPPLSGYPTVQDGVQARTGTLPGGFDRIAACLGARPCTLADGRSVPGLPLSATAKVLPTLYPDLTRASSGQPCSYLTIPTQDFAWARTTILSPTPPPAYAYPVASGGTATLSGAAGSLNQQVAGTARLPGWTPVTQTWGASADSPVGHGVCAGNDAWVFGFTGLSALPSASFHPNPVGQAVLADAIAAAAMAATAGQ